MSVLGLVADYGSDSDNSATNDDDIAPVALKEEMLVKSDNVKGQNLLEMEDSSSDEEDQEERPPEKKESVCTQNRLPNPLLDKPNFDSPFKESVSENSETLARYSVFSNQYREAEKAKDQILEKHVKMTENLNTQNKQVCWKFKKGKCRFGKNCKYSHDLGEISTPDKTLTGNRDTGNSANNSNFSNGPAGVMYGHHPGWSADTEQAEQDDDSYMANIKRKRRAGINDSLLPSKKALLPLEKQRANERPWTVNSKR